MRCYSYTLDVKRFRWLISIKVYSSFFFKRNKNTHTLNIQIRTNTLLYSHFHWHHPQSIPSSCCSDSLYMHTHWPIFCLFAILALSFIRCVFVCQNVFGIVVVVGVFWPSFCCHYFTCFSLISLSVILIRG